MTYLGTTDWYGQIALGNVAGHRILSALGERESMSTTVQGEDIWRGNQLTPSPTSHTTVPTPPDAGEQMTVVSESASDTSAGTGVRTVRIEYLDANGDEQSEDVTMNGTTGVNTTATNIRFVQDMYSLTTGSNGVAEDHIKIHAQSDSGIVYSMIVRGSNRAVVPHRMVPNAKTLFLVGWTPSEVNDRRCVLRIRSTDVNGVLIPGVFSEKDVAYLRKSTPGEVRVYAKIPPLSIAKVTGWAASVNAEVSCSWWGVLVDD